MHFSEDDLRAALQRQDPGPRFTQRVMAELKPNQTPEHLARARPAWRGLLLRPALAVVLAMAILLAAGLGYRQHEQNERRRLQEQAMGREAERQAIVALRIANDKLNRVFQRVRDSQRGARMPAIRRGKL